LRDKAARRISNEGREIRIIQFPCDATLSLGFGRVRSVKEGILTVDAILDSYEHFSGISRDFLLDGLARICGRDELGVPVKRTSSEPWEMEGLRIHDDGTITDSVSGPRDVIWQFHSRFMDGTIASGAREWFNFPSLGAKAHSGA
jgi:hypothetical protein